MQTLKLRMALTEDLLEHAEVVAQMFMQVMFRTIGENMLEELSEAEITYPQMQALRFLITHNLVTVGSLAEGLDISYPSATNMMHRLAKKGLIQRIPNPRDRRQVGIKLTEPGKALIARIDQARRDRFALILAQMEESDRRAFIQGLHSFIRTGMEKGVLPAEDICLHCGSQRDPLCPIVELQSTTFCR